MPSANQVNLFLPSASIIFAGESIKMRNDENVYCRKAECSERNCQHPGCHNPEEWLFGGERVLRYLDVRASLRVAGAERVYGEMEVLESERSADDSVEVPHQADRRRRD